MSYRQLKRNFNIEYMKSLNVEYGEWDPEEDDSFYENEFIVGDNYSDNELQESYDNLSNIFEEKDLNNIYTDIVLNLLNQSIAGELKYLSITDASGKILLDKEWDRN